MWGSGISLLAAMAALFLGATSTLENLELKSYDLRFLLRGPEEVTGTGIVIVALDEQTLASIPQKLPYPREYYARLIDNLTAAGARLIVFDLAFTEPSLSNPGEDLVLARAALRSGRVIFAGQVVIERATNDVINTYLLEPIAPLLSDRTDWGLINVVEDNDGFIRRYLLYQEVNRQKFLPLALRAYLHLTTVKAELDHEAKNGSALRLNGRELPYFNLNTFLINFRGPAGAFPTYSLANVLDDSGFSLNELEDTDIFAEHLRWGTFKNKIVFVGASAEELQDNKLSPFFSHGRIKRKMPGVEVHANALSTLLRGDFVTRLPRWHEYLLIALASFLAMFIVLPTRPGIGMLFGILEILALLVFALAFFSAKQLWVPVASPAAAILLSYIGNSAQLLVSERRERRHVRQVFSQYVSKNVVDAMLASGQKPEFGGEKREITVLFSDVRGFTTYCEKHAPEVVVQRLNEYLTEMVEIVFRNQGTLDKFVGDELMALYGAPHYYEDHAERACVTACEMIANLREIQKRWSANAQDYFQIGIGVNTGKMIVGNLGSQQKFDYTVIGDEVNLGARLEGANKQYWTSIIISESTFERVKPHARARELDLVRVKGKRKPVKIYELRSMNGLPDIEEDLIINVYQQGLEHYKNREWYKAITQFKRVLRYFPSDGPSRVYVARSLDFIENPPPLDWDGVYEFKTK
jgi:adenylate cyclase